MCSKNQRQEWVQFRKAPGDGDTQGSLVCCSSWGRKELETTEQLNANEENESVSCSVVSDFFQSQGLNTIKKFPQRKQKANVQLPQPLPEKINATFLYRTVSNLAPMLDKNYNICKRAWNLQNTLFKRIQWLPTTYRLQWKLFYRRCKAFPDLVPTYLSKSRLICHIISANSMLQGY